MTHVTRTNILKTGGDDILPKISLLNDLTENVIKGQKKGRVLLSDVKRDWQLYLLIFPVIVSFLLFQYRPMYGLQIAFKDYNVFLGITKSEWIRLEHFKNFFQDPYLYRIVRNTLVLNILSLIFSFPAPIILALLFNEVRNQTFRKTAQTCSYLPHFISTVIVVGIVVNFLSPSYGLVNAIIKKLGGDPVYFLIKPEFFRPIYILMGIWKEAGFGSIIFFAALSQIDAQQYEAAIIDGAGRLKQTIYITLPGIVPTIIILLILRLGAIVSSDFETIMLLYQPATYEVADVIGTYVYRLGFESTPRYDYGAAVGLLNSIVGLILVFGANMLSRKVSETSLW